MAAAQQGSPSPIDAAEKKLLGAEGLLGRGQYDLARQEFQDFLRTYANDPRSTRARYGAGVAEYNLNDLRAAELDLAAAAASKGFDKRDEALALLGTVQLQRDELAQAVATFQSLQHEYPKSSQVESAAVNEAQALYRMKKFGESLDAVRRLLAAFPKTGYRASALYVGALDQRALGDDAEAARTLNAIVETYPNSPFIYDAQILLGQLLAAQGKFDEAIGHFQKLQEDAPEAEKPAIEYGLGMVYLQAGKLAQAEETFERVGRQYATTQYAAPAMLERGVVQVKAGRREEARKTLAAAAQRYPSLAPSVEYWQARCDLLDGKFDAAARALERLTGAAIPEAAEVEFDLAYCELRLGHDDVALQRLEAFRQKYPHSPHTWEAVYYEASALYHLNRFEKSVEFAEAAEKGGDPRIARESSLLHGESLLMIGQYSKADAILAPLEKSPANEGERLRIQWRRAQAAYFSGDYKSAEERLLDVTKGGAANEDPALADANFLLGDAQLQRGEDAQAVNTLKAWLTGPGAASPRWLEAQYKLAMAQRRSNDVAGAQETLHALLHDGDAKSPWVQRAWYETAQLAWQSHDGDEAANALNKVLAADPDESIAAPALYLLARVEMSQHKEADAAGHLDRLLRSYPHNSLAEEAAFVRAMATKESGQFTSAADQFAAYVQDYPHGKYVTEARHQRAACLTALHQPKDAIAILSDLARTAPSDAILYDLAWAYRGAGDLPHAIDTYNSLVKKFPEGAQTGAARVELAQLLYGQKQYSEAQEQLNASLAESHGDPHLRGVAMYWLGCCEMRLGHPASASKTLQQFAAGNPRDPLAAQALSDAGDAEAQQGKFPEAIALQQCVIKQYQGAEVAPLAQLRLGETQNQASDYAAAEGTLEAFLKDHPNSPLAPRADFGIGWSLENRSQYEEARDWYAKAIAADNGETGARAQFQTGETYFAQKQFEAAARELLKVDILYSAPQWSARALYEAGRAFEELHEPDKARQQFELVVQKYKDADVAPLARKRLDALSSAKP
ncbi:MAG: tetratricopeptide repeat protein [Phycisphaerae bacterium]